LKLSAAAASHVRTLRDVAYGTDPRQRLDIFLPRQTDLRNLPVLLFMHGGAWTHGTKDWCGFMAPPIAHQPAIFVSVGYRLIPTVSFPAPVLDCIAALRWITEHIAEHGGSPHRLFVGGHSAGGQIAALMALRKDWLAQADLPMDAIKGCFCLATTHNRRMINPAIAPDHVQPEPPTPSHRIVHWRWLLARLWATGCGRGARGWCRSSSPGVVLTTRGSNEPGGR
jgi:arylformamidase